MATTNTTLSGAITASQTQITLAAYTAPTGKGMVLVQVDGELMRVADDSLSPTLLVVRGYNGTLAIAHGTLAPVAYGKQNDFVIPNAQPAQISYSVSGAIAVPQTPPNQEVFIVLNKAGVAAMTLAAPAADQNGLKLTITSNTANAHTVTATGLYQDGSTTTDVATFAAHAGAGLTIQAVNGKWNVINQNQITFT